MLTGGDNLTAEHKFQRSFNFTNYAKLVFSANRAPETMEDTNAFWRRWLIVTFPNSFNGSNADRELLAKLTTRDELSGFLNWAIEGLKRLRRNGWNFSNSKSTSMIREEYIRKSSPFKAFMTDCTEIVADGFVIKADLYDCYCVYCRERQLPIQSKETFFSKLPQLGQFQTGQHTIAGNRRWGLIGLALRKEDDWGKRTEEEERGAETSKPRSQDMVEQEKQGLGSAQAAQGASYLSPSTQGTCEYCNLFGEVALDYDRRYACAACAMEVKGS